MTARRSGTRPQDFSIGELLEWIHDQEMVLPEFQRDYNWTDDRVIALAATIMRGWPAGSLLLQELSENRFFELRAFADGPPLKKSSAALVVLDGQQRLTGLYHAIYDAGLTVYAIRASGINRGDSVDDLEEAMKSFDRDVWNRKYRNGEFSPDQDWIPLYALRSPSDYFAWRDDAVGRASDPEEAGLLIADAFRNGLERFQKYRFSAVIVEANLEPAAIARIFERVNRQGLALKTFDLMVARTFVTDWNLRDRWTDACASYPILDRFFEDDGMPVIQAIALAALANVREQAVLTLEPSLVRLEWEESVEAMARAVEFLVEECGVREPAWIPYGGIVVTLAALEREWRLEEHSEDVRRWFLSRSIGLSFETAANTVTVDEYRHLQQVFAGEQELRQVPISARVIREATRKRQGALWRSFLCCLSQAGALDVGIGCEGEDEATIPVALLEKGSSPRGLEPAYRLVLNQILASRDGARKVANKGLTEFSHHLDGLGKRKREKVLKRQMLPKELTPRMTPDQFINLRLGLFEQWLKSQLGYGFEASNADEE
jgi:Protein of unknown function DUF262